MYKFNRSGSIDNDDVLGPSSRFFQEPVSQPHPKRGVALFDTVQFLAQSRGRRFHRQV